jgi:hypothetical protein
MLRSISILLALFYFVSCSVHAAEAKPAKENKKTEKADPLSKFSDEDLADIGFCFQKFCEAVASKDAKVAAAFVADLPPHLAKLDLNKESDKRTLFSVVSKFEGAQLVKSQRLAAAGIGEVTYSDKSGKEQTQRMKNSGGRWKLAEL